MDRRDSGLQYAAVTDLSLSHAFDCVIDDTMRVLVLGSLPGQVSLREGRYYAHPQNQFWRLMSGVIDTDLVALPYAARLVALGQAGVGLWDVVASARRAGSLDSAIRNVEVRDLTAMFVRYPGLRAVAFNGATAARIGRKQLGSRSPVALLDLPSSSPAHTVGMAVKQPIWNAMRPYLQAG